MVRLLRVFLDTTIKPSALSVNCEFRYGLHDTSFCKAIVVQGNGIKNGSRLVPKTLAEDAKARHLEL